MCECGNLEKSGFLAITFFFVRFVFFCGEIMGLSIRGVCRNIWLEEISEKDEKIKLVGHSKNYSNFDVFLNTNNIRVKTQS